jgi:hypothetical protein
MGDRLGEDESCLSRRILYGLGPDPGGKELLADGAVLVRRVLAPIVMIGERAAVAIPGRHRE